MTKKNSLLAAFGTFALCTVYAFTHADSVRESVLTLFFPEGPCPIAAQQVAIAPAPAKDDNTVRLSWFPGNDTLPPLKDRTGDYIQNPNPNPVDLKDPKGVEQKVEYDPATNRYMISEKIGDEYFRAPTYMTFDEYVRWRERKQQQDYFDRLQGVATGDQRSRSGAVDPIAKFDVKNSLIDRLFGGTNVDIKPQGNINLKFGYDYQKIQNPILTLRQQRIGNFDFDMDINMSAAGKIGEKLNLNFNYNTRATFDFDNQMKLHYDTKGFSEDEILQNIEAGNVSMPLRSNLIKGAQNLFGVKADLKFGHLKTTLIASQQRSQHKNLSLKGGAQVQTFSKPIDEYDENRHFFVSHWNRDHFEKGMKNLPVVQSLFTITRMEVWITNDKNVTENFRDIVALADLAEPEKCDPKWKSKVTTHDITGSPLPDNHNNELYKEIEYDQKTNRSFRFTDRVVRHLNNSYGLKQSKDYEKVSARLLSPSEYAFNDQLGFVSINLNVQPDQVVGVAVEYTYNGQPYKIGEFSNEIPRTLDSINNNVLFVKMLKSTTANIQYPIWDLMMKNVYAIGTANVDPQEFRFDIFYQDPGLGEKRFLNGDDIPSSLKAHPLLQLFRLDNLNQQGDPNPDGIFDFVPGLTINLRSGRIMFPVLEPFGSYLANEILSNGGSQATVDKYAYPQLYALTPFKAREYQQLNRFTLKGTYKSATTSDISLGAFNLPKGSVKVSAGGRQLVEGIDYTVDYGIGKVHILNDAILQSGQAVNVSFEDNTLFGFQNRSMIGARFDYTIGKDISIGATYMNLFERPLTQKVNFGEDPINNKMYGVDFRISKDAPWLTKLVDKLPLISTKEPSNITAQAELAWLQPGHNSAINQGDTGGTVYIDDFEGSTSNLPLGIPANAWVIASVPQGDLTLFPESNETSLALGANRAGLSWYIADPSALDGVDGSNPYTATIQYQDLFPNRQLTPLEQSSLRPFDVNYFPDERGPYNFDLPASNNVGYTNKTTGVKLTSGLTKDGKLVEPQTRWAGIMRALNTNDFESANIEFLEFWVLNPYMTKTDNTPVSKPGSLYFDLGSVSEDIMRDSRQFFENAIPTSNTGGASANTVWGRVPVLPPVVNAFDNDPNLRAIQDVGLDGLNDADEQTFYKDWLAQMQGYLTASAYKDAFSDPSNDNFLYFKDPSFDQTTPGLITRYRKFNNQQGNSPVNNTQNLNPSATNLPDNEDLNRDNSLNENEAYYRYEIPMDVDPMHPNQLYADGPKLKNLVTDIIRDTLNGQMLTWYRFKVPLDYAQRKAINGIQDFRSIRFIRMFMKGFDQRTTFRFAALELGRNQWRRFSQQIPLTKPCITDMVVPDPTVSFDVNKVNIEENAARTPYNYTIPYGIQRQQSVGAFPDILQNEQALAMSVCNLKYCDARGIFKTLNMDIRQFKRIRMFVHAEAKGGDVLDQKSLKVFMRIGSDFVSNYYEYEIPVSPTIQADIAAHMNPDSREYKEAIWKPQNSFDFPLSLLTDLKKQRNATPGVLLSEPFEVPDQNTNNGLNLVRIVGNPNLGLVKGIMFGVRNSDPSLSPHCVELWINELRLSGFNEQGGYAGLARVDMKMADLGNVSLSGSYTSVGWGSIEQKLIQRSQDEIIQYDVSANLALDKLLPAKSGIKVPFYIQYSNITKNPLYDPYDLDIKLKDKIDAEADPIKKAQIREMAQDVTKVHGFNFTNVRKERKGTKKVPLPFDIENFSLTYAFNKLQRRTPFLLNDEQNQYKGAIDYQYSPGLKPIQPFKKLIKNDKYLKFLSEFNFSPLPSNLGFNTTLERLSGTTTYRFAGEDPKLNTYYNRRFTWDRNYSLGWDLTKALRMQFDATAKAIIDEPYAGDQPTTKLVRDSIWKNILHLGRPKSYTHSLNLNYTVPFKNFPFLDFITMKASYTGGYVWTAQSLLLQHMDTPTQFENIPNSRSLGNTIQNTSVRQINGDLDFTKLYDKIPYLARINKGSKGGGPGGGPGGPGGPGGGKGPGGGPGGNPDSGRPGMPGGPGGKMPGGGPGGKGDLSKSLQPAAVGKTLPNTDNPAVGGKDSRSAGGRIDPNAPGGAPGGGPGNPTADPSGAGGKDANGKDTGTAGGGKDKKDKKKKEREPSLAERIALRPLMLIRKARFTYSENYSTVVPGFVPDTKLMGLSEGFNAPGLAFVLGVQPGSSWLDDAAKKGWITYRPELNQQVLRNYTQNIDAGLTVEPFNDFRVEFTGTRQYVHNSTELFKNQNFNSLDPTQVDFQHRAQRDMGSFTVSYFSMNTLFNNDLNGLFRKYESYRPVISKRLATLAGNPDLYDDPNLPINQDPSKNYLKGYGPIQQQVLIPAFIAAYSNQDPNSVGLDLFKMRPALNWKLTYNGLAKVGNLSKVFSSISITHGYKNTLTVNSYNTDIFYDPQHPYGIDQLNYNYIARYEIPQIIINEQMQPLLGVDIKTKNDMSFKVDFKKSRTLALSLVDYQLAETRSSGYTVGFGYKMHNVIIPFLQFGKKTAKAKKAPKKTAKPATPGTKPAPTPASGTGQQANDLTFKFDFDLRDDITLNHRLDVPGDAIPTRGARTIAINPSVEYTINKRLKLRLFSDYRKTVPKTSQSFPITSVQTGIVVQFSLN